MMKTKNILVLSYWSYKDALIQTYTLPYLKIISKNIQPDGKIFLVTSEQPQLAISKDELITIKGELAKYNITLFPFRYFKFSFLSIVMWKFYLLKLIYLLCTKKIAFIHAWCTPAGSIGYILSKLTGIPLVLDSYEPHAEAMLENGTWKKNNLAFRILFKLEKLQSCRAKYFIATSSEMKKYAEKKYSCNLNNFFVKPACVNLQLFSNERYSIRSHAFQHDRKTTENIVCVYAGKFGGIYLTQEVFDFFKVASRFWKDKFSVMLLSGISEYELEQYCRKAGLDKKIITIKFVKHHEIPDYLSLADFAINPVKPVPTKRYCTSIKDGEYWAMGLPVVITSGISDDSDIIKKNNIGAVLESLDEQGYLKAVETINALLTNNTKEALYNKIRHIAEKYRSFSIAEKIYKKLYGVCP